MKAKLVIEMDNAAFDTEGNGPNLELARILSEARAWCERSAILTPGDEKILMDVNGNRVGSLKITR